MLNELVSDVAYNLGLEYAGCIDERDEKHIINAIKATFDKFSIDGRKLNVIDEIKFVINDCKNSYTIGRTGDFNLHASPQSLFYAAWQHVPDCGCRVDFCCDAHTRVGKNYWISEDPIEINHNINQLHWESLSRDNTVGLPYQMWYQQGGQNGEIKFDRIPYRGSVLMLRALVPFDVRIADKCCDTKKKCEKEFEFIICPSWKLSAETKHNILCNAERLFDGNEGWQWCTTAETCEACPQIIEVKVTVRRCTTYSNAPIEACGELPPGYYGALRDIVTYEAAKPKDRTPQVRQARDMSTRLLHRSNQKQHPDEVDNCNPFTNRCRTNTDINDLGRCG